MVSIDEFLPIPNQRNGFLLFLEAIDFSEELVEAMPPILGDSSKFYRKFSIPKRSGGMRELHSPYPSLRAIQHQINSQVLSGFAVHECAMAYSVGSTARKHAENHVQGDELLVVDIENFFPSITRQLVFEALVGNGLSSNVSHYIALLCTLNGGLPQGACTSPVLSNLVFFRLDNRLKRLAQSLGLVYSRYADDLAFSGAHVPRNLSKSIEKIVGSKSFRLNVGKTKLKIQGSRKILTGISISSGVLKVPKTFKRKLRAELYELERNLLNLGQLPTIDPFVFERVLGRLNYLLHIEPDNRYAQQKRNDLSISHQKMLSLIDFAPIPFEDSVFVSEEAS